MFMKCSVCLLSFRCVSRFFSVFIRFSVRVVSVQCLLGFECVFVVFSSARVQRFQC